MASETAFTALVRELKLDDLSPKFKENGWLTFGDFAFATGDTEGKNSELFQKEVVEVVLASDGSQKAFIPRPRRLYAQAYMVASQAMAEYANPHGGPRENAHVQRRSHSPHQGAPREDHRL